MKKILPILYILCAVLCCFNKDILLLCFACGMGWLMAALWAARFAYLEKGGAE